MKKATFIIFTSIALCSLSAYSQNENIVSYVVDPISQDLRLYWKNASGENYGSFENLKENLESKGKQLVFAMNGGMYQEDRRPLGLFKENGEIKYRLNKTQDAYGNFYLQPNGIFYLNKIRKAHVVRTDEFEQNEEVVYATQSGPMLLIDGQVHPKLTQGSKNKHVRNGVGILPDGKVIFAISEQRINFYDFATFFQELGCKNALYLDGFVSRMYLPEKDLTDEGGNFGVIIALTK